MAELTFITGGARSGKSSYAVDIAKKHGGQVILIATAVVFDEEMKTRVAAHRQSRPANWEVVEEPRNLSPLISEISDRRDEDILILIDCLGLFITNLLLDDFSDEEMNLRIECLVKTIGQSKNSIIIVSNEVGEGIVPENALSRRFRDFVGLANQKMAQKSNTAIFMRCGIPQYLKGENDYA